MGIWTAMLNCKRNLWRAYAIDAERKMYLIRGPVAEGTAKALQGLKALLPPPTRKRAPAQKRKAEPSK